MILTKTIETNVLGVCAYHVRCDCGFETKRYDSQKVANRKAAEHASEHARAEELLAHQQATGEERRPGQEEWEEAGMTD